MLSKYFTVSFFPGLGNYKLLPQFSMALRDVDELCLLSCYSPDELPDSIFQSKDSGLAYENNKENLSHFEEGKIMASKFELLIIGAIHYRSC